MGDQTGHNRYPYDPPSIWGVLPGAPAPADAEKWWHHALAVVLVIGLMVTIAGAAYGIVLRSLSGA